LLLLLLLLLLLFSDACHGATATDGCSVRCFASFVFAG
jgi:hypothetical protein